MRGALLALVCTGACCFAAVAAADPYTDFRVPEARSLTWLVNGSGRWSGNYNAIPGTNENTDQLRGDLSSFTHWHAESERFVADHVLAASSRPPRRSSR